MSSSQVLALLVGAFFIGAFMQPDDATMVWIKQELRDAAADYDEYDSWELYWREAMPRPLNRFGADDPAELPTDLTDWIKDA